MVDKVHAHVKEMLEAGTIHPSQSPWCDAVVLVCKKDGGLCFCIDFCKLSGRMKKDSYPLPQMQEAIESLVGAGCFSCLDLKVGLWQITMDEASKQYTTFTAGNMGFFKCECLPFGLCSAPATFQRLMQNCPRRTKPDVLLNLSGWCNSLLGDGGGALEMFMHCVWSLLGAWPWAGTH